MKNSTIAALVTLVLLPFVASNHHDAGWPGLGQIISEIAAPFFWPLCIAATVISIVSLIRMRQAATREFAVLDLLLTLPAVGIGIARLWDYYMSA